MSLPEKNRTCGFCKYAKPTAKHDIINCDNKEAIYQQRVKIYRRSTITPKREHSDRFTWSMFKNRTCEGFEERADAQKELIGIKMRGEYREWYHEVAE